VRASDIVGVAYVGAITAFIVFQNELFISLTARYPYPMGFAKIALLATFGECLKYRLTTGQWIPEKIAVRFLVWGVFGALVYGSVPPSLPAACKRSQRATYGFSLAILDERMDQCPWGLCVLHDVHTLLDRRYDS
jgi:hypothetical protein